MYTDAYHVLKRESKTKTKKKQKTNYHQRKNSKLLSSVKLQPVYQNASYELK